LKLIDSHDTAGADDDPTAGEPRAMPSIESLVGKTRRGFIYGLSLGIAVIVAVIVLTSGEAFRRAIREFDWRLIPFVLGLTLSNYALRFVKWHLYLRWVGVRQVRLLTSLLVFLAGLSMAITPAKLGEFLKSYLLRRASGTPMAVTAPIVVAERLTDGLAMLILAGVGLFAVEYGWQVFAVLATVLVAVIAFLQRRALVHAVLKRLGAVPFFAGRVRALETMYESIWILLRPDHLGLATAIGIVSWSGECLAFFLILIGLGVDASLHMLVVATFILASATILGSLSMLPGGLGAAEASVAGLLLLLTRRDTLSSDGAAAATLMIRFATLWFGVLLGVLALPLAERHLGREPDATTRSDA
jgi:uncharacterized protein (TIRG00374 family)